MRILTSYRWPDVEIKKFGRTKSISLYQIPDDRICISVYSIPELIKILKSFTRKSNVKTKRKKHR